MNWALEDEQDFTNGSRRDLQAKPETHAKGKVGRAGVKVAASADRHTGEERMTQSLLPPGNGRDQNYILKT